MKTYLRKKDLLAMLPNYSWELRGTLVRKEREVDPEFVEKKINNRETMIGRAWTDGYRIYIRISEQWIWLEGLRKQEVTA